VTSGGKRCCDFGNVLNKVSYDCGGALPGELAVRDFVSRDFLAKH